MMSKNVMPISIKQFKHYPHGMEEMLNGDYVSVRDYEELMSMNQALIKDNEKWHQKCVAFERSRNKHKERCYALAYGVDSKLVATHGVGDG